MSEFENYRHVLCVTLNSIYRYDDHSSSSDDSAFSDGFDPRLDESFNEMISQRKKKRKIEEQQLIDSKEVHIENGDAGENLSTVHVQEKIEGNNKSISIVDESYPVESIVTYQSSGDGAVEKISVDNPLIFVKDEPVEKCQSIESGVGVEETTVINGVEEVQVIPKNE